MTTITHEWKEEFGDFRRYTSYDGKLPYPGNPDLSIETGASPDEFRVEFPGTTDMGEACYIESSVMVSFLDHHNLNTTANDLRAQLAEANRTIEALRVESAKHRLALCRLIRAATAHNSRTSKCLSLDDMAAIDTAIREATDAL